MDADENIKPQGRHFHCELCNVKLPNEATAEHHINGKKHKRLVEMKTFRGMEAEHSIFVGGLSKLVSELALTDHFMQFGGIAKVFVDKDKGKYAILVFAEKESVAKAVALPKQTLQGCQLTVKPRENTQLLFTRHNSGQQGAADEMQQMIVNKLTPVDQVSDQMKELVSLLEVPPSGIRLRYLICSLLREVIKEFMPSCQVVPFGSSVNGFGNHGCDLDIHLEPRADPAFTYKFATMPPELSTDDQDEHDELMEGVTEEDDEDTSTKGATGKQELTIDMDNARPQDILYLVSKILRQCVPACHAVKHILCARRPVVKFRHRVSKMDGDITMDNRLAMRNTELLHYYSTADERVRPLVYTVRHWAKAVRPKGVKLSNYALTLMVVYYLQNRSPAILPSVDQLREGKELTDAAELIEEWECSFSTEGWSSTNTETLVDLLREFFRFYSTFDFATQVICPKTGTAKPITALFGTSQPFVLASINVQDPFELTHNVAKNVNAKVMPGYLKEIKMAYTLCLSNRFKRKKPSSAASADEGYTGLPVIFDPANYNTRSTCSGSVGESSSKSEGKGTLSSTEGARTDQSTYSMDIKMKPTRLPLDFIKAHDSPHDLRKAWCSATVPLLKRILREVLLLQCVEEERMSDEGQTAMCVEEDVTGGGKNEEDGVEGVPAKRLKLSPGVDDTTGGEARIDGAQIDMEQEPPLICSATHQVWIGRRHVRRRLKQTRPELLEETTMEQRLNVEALVTADIILAQEKTPASTCELLTKFKLSFTSGGERGIKLVFQPLQGVQHFKELLNFLKLYLIKYVDVNDFI